MIMVLLSIISIWDLLKKEIPVPLLIIFSIAAAGQLFTGNVSLRMTTCILAVWMAGAGILLTRKGKMGGGDVWVLVSLAVAWPFELFWQSVVTGTMMLCTVALGMLSLTKNENVQIPMVPFLLLGCCM